MSTTFEKIADELLETIERQRAQIKALTDELTELQEEHSNVRRDRGAAEGLLRQIVSECHATEGGVIQTFAPSKELLIEAHTLVIGCPVSTKPHSHGPDFSVADCFCTAPTYVPSFNGKRIKGGLLLAPPLQPKLCPALEDSRTCQLPEGHAGESHFDGSVGAWQLESCCWCGNAERDLINSEDGLECDDKEACLLDLDAKAKAADKERGT